MPATKGRKSADGYVLGVDGCRAGWAFVRVNLYGGAISGDVARSFRDIMEGPGADALMIMADMPIGLVNRGRRACEGQAREILKPRRTSSVFPSPRRPMLGFAAYEEANQWGKQQGPDGGGGLSKQAWMITPKIREIDAVISPDDQDRLGEGHPEVAFTRLNDGEPCRFAKRTTEGKRERRALLSRNGLTSAHDLFRRLKQMHGSGVAEDDIYDACALALTARARLEGKAIRLSDDERDARGLVMEIWG